MVKLEVIQLLLDIFYFKGFKIFQMDVKTVFLNSYITMDVYVK